jgi:hypothetical protein
LTTTREVLKKTSKKVMIPTKAIRKKKKSGTEIGIGIMTKIDQSEKMKPNLSIEKKRFSKKNY